MELGPIEQNIAKQAIRSGQELPERIANAPELQDGLLLYLNAFFDLDSERVHVDNAVRIPWHAIAGYADYYEFDFEQRQDLVYFIRKMDLSHCERIQKKKQNGKP